MVLRIADTYDLMPLLLIGLLLVLATAVTISHAACARRPAAS
jgi:hypothetical protein